MGSRFKQKPAQLYGNLLSIYPQSFRKHFGSTMVQTFDDMLDEQPTRLGRLQVWARALVDLPVSAAKEHITDGEDIHMNRNMKLLLTALTLAIVIVGIGSFWFGNLHAKQNVTIERATVAQLADAMQQDHFYSDYGNSALLFNAKVQAVRDQGNGSLVTFATNRPYGVSCEFSDRITAHIGQTIAIAAPGGSADRQKHGVLLHDCVQN